MRGFVGIGLLMAICYVLTADKKNINYKEVLACLCIQFIIAFMCLKFSIVSDAFLFVAHLIDGVRTATEEGTKFVFGYLGSQSDIPFVTKQAGSMFIFAFHALPMILVFSALSMLGFYFNVIQRFISLISNVAKRFSNIGGTLCLVSASKIVLGIVEAPLLIRPYLEKLSKSELFTVMTLGFATTSGAAILLYGSILGSKIPNAMIYILTVTLINIPSAIMVARLLIPHVGQPTDGQISVPYKFDSAVDAVSKGTSDGLNVISAMASILIVTIALISMFNQCLSILPNVNEAPITLQRIIGIFFIPIAYIIGIPTADVFKVGELLAQKVVINEVVAFFDLINSQSLSERSIIMSTCALCNFANFSSMGIVVSAYTSLAKAIKTDVVNLCFKSLLAGICANCISTAIVGIIL